MKTIIAFFLLFLPNLDAVQDHEKEENREQLVLQLDDEKLDVREAAATELVERGEGVLPWLKKVAASPPSAEVGARVRAIIREILFLPGANKLLREIRTGLWAGYDDVDRRPKFREELVVGVSREIRANPELMTPYSRMVLPDLSGDFWKQLKEAVAALKEAKAVFCIASGLFHDRYLIQLHCSEALAALGKKNVIPTLLEIAEGLAYPVYGSKSATVHDYRQAGIAKAIDWILGTTAWKKDDVGTQALKTALVIWHEAFEKTKKRR